MEEKSHEEKMIERRKDERISGSLIEYSFLGVESLKVTTFMKDLSKGGTCIYVNEEIDTGTELILYLYLYGYDAPIEAIGKIMWKKESTYYKRFEMGLQFTKIDDAERKRLSWYIEKKDIPLTEEFKTSLIVPKEEIEDGILKQYYNSKELLSEVNIVNGVMEGLKTYYYKSGEVLEEVEMKAGVREGLRKCYDKNGVVRIEQTFENGKSVSIMKFDEKGNHLPDL